MSQDRDIRTSLPLTHLSFHVLLALAGSRDLHGYGIVQAVEELSGGALTPGTGTFYSALHRLQEDGLLEEAVSPTGSASRGPRRRYYRLTGLGSRVLAAETERLEALLAKARTRLAGSAGVG